MLQDLEEADSPKGEAHRFLAFLKTFFYLSLGSEENEKMRAAYQQACSILAQAQNTKLRWHGDVVAGADHNSNPEKATPLGFKALYQDTQAVMP
jgi:hypothetical protein